MHPSLANHIAGLKEKLLGATPSQPYTPMMKDWYLSEEESKGGM